MATYAARPATAPLSPTPAPALAAALCALLVSVLGLALVWRTPQGLFRDPVAQLRALRQYVAGQSPTFNTVVAPSPEDLSRDTHEWVVIWPPGMGLVLLPFVAHGVRLATAVRALSMICYVLGSVGWALWFGEFRMPRPVLLALAAAMPLSHYATTPLFQYYTESFNWAFVPWVLLGALLPARSWQQPSGVRLFVRALLLGIGLGALYWLKYSAIFVSGGVLVFFVVLSARKQSGRKLAPLLAIALPCFAAVGSLLVWNKVMGTAANYAAETFGWFPRWKNLSDCIGLFTLALADAESLLHWVFLKPGHPLLQAKFLPLAAFPAGVALFWLLFRRREVEMSVWIARSVAITSALGLAAVWTLSAEGAGHEARHLATAAMASVPVAVQEAGFLFRRWQRLLFVAGGCLFIGVPLLYGAAALGGKALRTRGYSTGPSGFYNSVWTAKDPVSVVRRLQLTASPDALWYVCEGTVAMDLPGRTLLRWAALSDVAELARETYRSSVPMRVNLLLPPDFEHNGKGAVIRASFPQAQRWVASKVDGAEYTLWSTTLN